MQIYYLPKFARQYKKLPKDIRDIAKEREQVFRQNPFDSRLKTHKLKGPLKSFWSFSVTNQDRIIFDFADEGVVRFYSIGSHDIYE